MAFFAVRPAVVSRPTWRKILLSSVRKVAASTAPMTPRGLSHFRDRTIARGLNPERRRARVPPMQLDLNFVRSQFPAFSQPSLKDQAFFENAGGSYPCRQVVDRLTRFYRERKVQPYAPYAISQLGGEEMDEARRRLAAMLGVETDEVSFGPSTTQNTYVLAQAFAAFCKPGDAIIVTDQDHEANSGPWRRLADRGIEIREWKLDPDTGHLPIDGLKALLDDKVKLVCFPHCSNIVAEI